MRLIIMAVGIAVLLLLALRTRRKPAAAYRDALLEDDLPAHMAALAIRRSARGRGKLAIPRGMLRRLRRDVSTLNRHDREELLPAAQWLGDNGRFLQETVVATQRELKAAPLLPKDESGELLVMRLAGELLGHSNAELKTEALRQAVAAWQQRDPLTVDELNCLPLALKCALLQMLDELIALTARRQAAYSAAPAFARALLGHDLPKARRRFARDGQEPAFLEHLLSLLRVSEDPAAVQWLDRYMADNGNQAEQLAQAEHEQRTENQLWIGNAITSLRLIGRVPWQRRLEEMSLIDAQLRQDATYPRMDGESRAYYRHRVKQLSRRARRPELSVCASALALASRAEPESVEAHVGYYLLDEGERSLLLALRGRVPRVGLFARAHACGLLRAASWVFFACAVLVALRLGVEAALALPVALVSLEPFQLAVARLLARFLAPRLVPRMRVDRLDDATRTLVVCPTLLHDREHALSMVRQLLILNQANPDPNLHFLLLGDERDSLTAISQGDEEIITTAAAAVRALCEDTGHTFLYLQRARAFNNADHRFESRERKRGSLDTLLRMIEGLPIEDAFTYQSFPRESLTGRYRYVITLDSDTFMPPGAALRMIGAMTHPLQRRRETHGRMRGVSIIQPRIEITPHAIESRLALLLGGRGGADPYNALIPDMMHDLCGRGSFVGKGIIDPKGFLAATEGRIMPGCVLSHDLLEGELSGCRTATDIALYDGHPATLRATLWRLHRWTRGDWQLLPYLLPVAPGRARAPGSGLDATGKHKLWQNLLRSLYAPARLLVAVLAVALGRPWLLALALLACGLATLAPREPESWLGLLVRLMALPCRACIQADAIARALWRTFVSRRKLLEWTTAAQLQKPSVRPPMLFFHISYAAALASAFVALLPGALLWPGLALAALWALFPAVLPTLEAAWHRPQRLTDAMRDELGRLAENTFSFFESYVVEKESFLPPDNVQSDPNTGVARRTSPTNIGLYLVSLIAAERMGLLAPDELGLRLSRTLATVEKLPKWEGHLYNWYDTRTCAPMRPLFVSSVDSGNLAVCLLCCAQGVRALLPRLSERYHDLGARLDALACGMRFQALYDAEAELFFIGAHPGEKRDSLSHYDLLASEARLTSFVAIMLGQIPVKHWFRLGRGLTRTRGGQTLVSYSGTMFEYMMPLLFQPPVRGTLLWQACVAALREQRRHRYGGVFGVSESGYYAFDPNLCYQYRAFGIPALALDPTRRENVVAPYASLLTLPLDAKRAVLNARRMRSLGWDGPLGFFEAADFARDRVGGQPFRIVRSHMAHHQGMIMLSLCNALCEGYIAGLFSGLPRAQAHALLLEERPLRGRTALKRPLKRVEREKAITPFQATRSAYPLCFPADGHLLRGAGTTLFVDAQGGGYLSRNGVFATRFDEACHIPSGMRFFLRDSQSGVFWSATDPTLPGATEFESAQAVFLRTRAQIESSLRFFVSPLDGVALCCLTVKNTGETERMLEACSYLEPSLSSQREDAAHPAFQNLFIRTERVGACGVMATKRARKPGDEPRRLLHALCSNLSLTARRVQTDRAVFLGRNGSPLAPRSLSDPIGVEMDPLGDVVEPCLSLRVQFTLPAKGQGRIVFATLLMEKQDSPASFVERYALPESADTRFELSRTMALVTARYLGLDAPAQNAVSRLCASLVYTEQPHQRRYAGMAAKPLRALWGLGIGGDLPIAVAVCEDTRALDLARLLLKAHAFYRMSGLWMDLVLLVDQTEGALHPLHDALSDLCQTSPSRDMLGKDGGVHLLRREELSRELYDLLLASARIVLSGGAEGLGEQLKRMLRPVRVPPADAPPLAPRWEPRTLSHDELLFDNGYGGFSRRDGSYVIGLPPAAETPAPWCNWLVSTALGTLACESGLLFSYALNSQSGRLTRWSNDAVAPWPGELFIFHDAANGLRWSPTRAPLGRGLSMQTTHAVGVTTYECHAYGLYQRLCCFTDRELPFGVRALSVRNDDTAERSLTFYHACAFTLGANATENQLTATDQDAVAIYAQNPAREGVACLLAVDPPPTLLTTMCAGLFYGLAGGAPYALTAETPPGDAGDMGVLCFTFTLKPGESAAITTALGFDRTRQALSRAADILRRDGATLRLHLTKQDWEERLGGLRLDLPDPAFSLMLNRWLPYQVRAARLLARAGFYQAGGAIGFRDQLQDMLSLLLTAPDEVRAHLLLCAQHQYEEGDVQHWWHPPRLGVRTRISDDLLFLPFVTALYVEATGDTGVLHQEAPYLHGEPLPEGEGERMGEPSVSELSEPLRKHCLRAIERVRYGARGLPLMGGGDWNDGMNHVGGERGESVWLGMFLCEVLRRFQPLCDEPDAERLLKRRLALLTALDRHAWDGAWYLRGWYDSGAPLGSSHSAECKIDALPQCWAVFSGLSRERCTIAMENLWRLLFDAEAGLMRLFTPPFDGAEEPGYIAGYLPGVRENGGQYTHAATWAVAALHQLGRDDRAWQLASALLPIRHAETRRQAERYRVEPYVLAADVYDNPQQRGRGGWTWYTGSASWLYYVLLTQLLGIRKTGDALRLRPVVPEGWDGFTITYRYGTATYHLHASRACPFPVCDGEALEQGTLTLVDDGRIHEATFPLHAAVAAEER